MTLGALARRLLGPLFPAVGRAYRGFFVDVEAVAETLPPLAPGTHVLDVGGGDGIVLDAWLRRHPGARATLLDLAPAIGGALSPEVRARVELVSATGLAEYRAARRPVGDVVVISDVVHHVPPAERAAFFDQLRALIVPRAALLVVKDIEPGGIVAALSWLSDRFVSGDRHVRLAPRAEVIALVRAAFGPVAMEETELLRLDPPNYCLVFRLAEEGGAVRD
jgi:2-polyprenyl-6-hydroxyphenyl methylase/3-demethylubiquinone-9 3-methyltransferase